MSLSVDIRCAGEGDFKLALNSEIPGAGVTAIYGPSGSGKSTLLDCIAGLRQPGPGSAIRFGDWDWHSDRQQLPSWQRRIGYVFQDARLFPHLDARGNLEYALRRRAVDDGLTLEQVAQWLELGNLLSQLPAALSAGQRQRVAIGRALLSAPLLLLLDEPLANLDHNASQQCLKYLRRLARELQLPMLYVSHDIEEVCQLADHLALLEQGRLVAQGSLLDMCNRLDSRLAHEEQAAAIAVAAIRQHDTEFGLTRLDLEGQAIWVNHLEEPEGQHRRLRIAARDVSVCREKPGDSSILNILSVTLDDMESASDNRSRIMLRLAIGSQYLLARITRKSAATLKLRPGDQLYAQVKSAALLSEELTQL
jgi:molybdate transport system ATP-binding protein